jgi:hypothetical protein
VRLSDRSHTPGSHSRDLYASDRYLCNLSKGTTACIVSPRTESEVWAPGQACPQRHHGPLGGPGWAGEVARPSARRAARQPNGWVHTRCESRSRKQLCASAQLQARAILALAVLNLVQQHPGIRATAVHTRCEPDAMDYDGAWSPLIRPPALGGRMLIHGMRGREA